MPSSPAIRAGRAFVELFADDRRLVRGLKRASQRLKNWGRGVASLGTKLFAVGAGVISTFMVAVRQFMSAGDALDKMSSRVGASVEFLSALSHAAQIGGTDISAMEVGIRRLQRTAYDAARGLSTATDAFGDLGISIIGADGQLKGTEQLFMESAAALSRMTNNTKKAALATVIFGRAGTQLLPMLKNGADGLVAVMEEAQRLGLVMSTEDATAAAELTDAWTRLASVLKMTAVRIGAALAPMLTDLAERMTKVVRPVIDWIRHNSRLIVTALKLAAVVTGLGAGLLALAAASFTSGMVLSMLAGAFSLVGSLLGGLVTLLGAVLSPIGLVTTAVAALGAYLIKVSGAGRKALAWLGRQFDALRDTALAAWQGISDALAAGDIALAAKVLWLTLQVEWTKGIAALVAKWVAFKETMLTVWTEAVFGTAKILTTAWAGVQAAWVETVTFLSQAWLKFTETIVSGWSTVQNWLAKKFVELWGTFDDSIDVEGVKRILDEDYQREKKNRQRSAEQHQQDIEAGRQQRLAAIGQQEQATLTELDREKAARQAAQKDVYADQLHKAEDAVKQARTEWQKALDEAASRRATSARKRGRNPLDQLNGLDLSAVGGDATSVRGTFNALAARGLAGSSPLDRVAKGVEAMDKKVGVLVREAQHGGLVFA